MKRSLITLALLSSVLLMPAAAQAALIDHDGNISNWGVTPGVYGATVWTPTPDAGIRFTAEDQIADYLTPGYGGQLFDAEAMYARYDNTNLYYAIVTGHPNTGASGYKPGDIAFDFGSNGSYEYGIKTVTNGLTAGDLYSVNSWNLDPFWTPKSVTTINTINGAGPVGIGELAYNNTFYGAANQGSHYVIEGYIPLSSFGSNWGEGKNFTMSWTETCGNDVIKLSVTPTPEPLTMTLFGIGLAGMGILRRKQLFA